MQGSRTRGTDRRRLAFHSKLGFFFVWSRGRSPQWDAQHQQAQGSARTLPILFAWGALAVGLVVALFSQRDSASSALASAPIAPPTLAGLGPLDILTDATRVIRYYLAASSVDDKVYYARRPRAVRPLMERYYQARPVVPIEATEIKMIGKLDDLQREHPLYLAAALLGKDEVIPLILEEREGRYRVDWESHVGYSPSTVDDFLAMRYGQSMWFRLYATECDYYNYTFTNSRMYLCLKLDFPGQPEPYYGYIRRDHPDCLTLRTLLAQGKRVPMILNLRRSEGSGTNQLNIVSLEQELWFVDQDPGTYAPAWSNPRHCISNWLSSSQSLSSLRVSS